MAIKNNYDMIHSFFYDSLDSYCSKSWITVSYSRGRLYSYSTCIAEFKKDINNDLILIISDNTFSNTTAKHLGIVRSANPRYKIVCFPQDYGNRGFYANDVLNSITNILDYSSKQLTKQAYRNNFLNAYYMLDAYLQIQEFSSNFDKIQELKELHQNSFEICCNAEKLKELKTQTRKANTEKLKAKKEKEKQIKTYINDFITKKGYLSFIQALFLNHQEFNDTSYRPSELFDTFNTKSYSYIWISGDKIKTSQRITVELKEVKTLLHRFIKNKPILGHKISHYTILEVNQDYIKIGCHKIPMDNIKALINELFNDTDIKEVA